MGSRKQAKIIIGEIFGAVVESSIRRESQSIPLDQIARVVGLLFNLE